MGFVLKIKFRLVIWYFNFTKKCSAFCLIKIKGHLFISFQFTGGVSCLTFLPAAPPGQLQGHQLVPPFTDVSPPIQYISQWGGSGLGGDVSPPPPAAALTGVPSPNSCPSSVATTSSLPSLPPPPAPWWLSLGLSWLSQQLGEAGLRTFQRSPCILLLRDGWSRPIPRLCTPPPDQSTWAAWTRAPLVFPLPMAQSTQ